MEIDGFTHIKHTSLCIHHNVYTGAVAELMQFFLKIRHGGPFFVRIDTQSHFAYNLGCYQLKRVHKEYLMRLRNITGCQEMIAGSKYVVNEDELEKCPGTWHERFGNNNPIRIEIGMGKGRFIHELASLNPDINYIGIEKYSAVLLRAVQKMESDEKPNLIFLRMDAEDITKVFAPGEIDRIYLNFSDPWPKDRHAKRRLPSRQFLERYDKVLKKDGCIEFKTDNRGLFDFAVEELEPAGWKADYISYDLHADEKLMQGNVMTEYEEKFSALGNPIYKYCIRR